MTDSLLRWLSLSAAAGMTSSELRSVIDAIQTTDQEELLHVYNEIRRRVRQIQFSDIDGQIEFGFSSKTPFNAVRHDILQLAKRENVKASDAAEKIRGKLLMLPNIDHGLIPIFNAREGFGRWIDKVARLVGSSALLNAAISALAPENSNDPQKWRLSRL